MAIELTLTMQGIGRPIACLDWILKNAPVIKFQALKIEFHLRRQTHLRIEGSHNLITLDLQILQLQ